MDKAPLPQVMFYQHGEWADLPQMVEPDVFVAAFSNGVDQALPLCFIPMIEAHIAVLGGAAHECLRNGDQVTYTELLHTRGEWRRALQRIEFLLARNTRLRAN